MSNLDLAFEILENVVNILKQLLEIKSMFKDYDNSWLAALLTLKRIFVYGNVNNVTKPQYNQSQIFLHFGTFFLSIHKSI